MDETAQRVADTLSNLVVTCPLYVSTVLQVAERSGASRLVLLAPDEWEKDLIKIKHLATREEEDVAASTLLTDDV